MMNKNQKIALAISVIIPVAVLLIVLFLVISPLGKANPTTDFIYSMGPFDNGNGNIMFQVKDGKLVVVETKYPNTPDYKQPTKLIDGKPVTNTVPDIYYHDVVKNESHKITLEEAKALTLDATSKSPDGYKIERIYGRGGGTTWPIPSPYSDSYGYSGYGDVYLTKGSLSKKMEVQEGVNSGYYYQDFSFIAWVTK